MHSLIRMELINGPSRDGIEYVSVCLQWNMTYENHVGVQWFEFLANS